MGKHLQKDKYPKVKVREQSGEADQYGYERNSLQSLKAFEWLSLDLFSSSDESPQSVVRVPGFPKSPTPGFLASKEETNKSHDRKNVRATSAPRPRAVLSSPDNDGIIRSKAQTRRELLSALKNHNSCENRHAKCKVFPRSEGAEITRSKGRRKNPAESKNCIQTTLADPSIDKAS